MKMKLPEIFQILIFINFFDVRDLFIFIFFIVCLGLYTKISDVYCGGVASVLLYLSGYGEMLGYDECERRCDASLDCFGFVFLTQEEICYFRAPGCREHLTQSEFFDYYEKISKKLKTKTKKIESFVFLLILRRYIISNHFTELDTNYFSN